jgi:tetratricopeptide (TPR) repeat protein
MEKQGNCHGALVGSTSYKIGLLYKRMGRLDSAVTMLEEAKTHLAVVGDQAGAHASVALLYADACSELAECYASAGKEHLHLAVVQFEDVKAAWEAAGDRAKADSICYPLGVLYQGTGQYDRAVEMLQKAKSNAAALRDREGLGKASAALGKCHQSLGQCELAIAEFEEEKRSCPNELQEARALLKEMLGLCNSGKWNSALALEYRAQTLANKLEGMSFMFLASNLHLLVQFTQEKMFCIEKMEASMEKITNLARQFEAESSREDKQLFFSILKLKTDFIDPLRKASKFAESLEYHSTIRQRDGSESSRKKVKS